MPDRDQALRLAAAAQHALDRGYRVTAVAPAAVALRMVVDGHADVVIAAGLDDLPQIEVAAGPPVVPRLPAGPDEAVPPTRRRPRRSRRAPGDAPGGL
ncbi:hypothetical protein [Micromonospora aurantiaca (nom. illeg.)]|uniref:hypothetical protein n=1 Tax=Micromonospora aurantiaca (nom. illeg.) TaxID=47850 RepID=UPI003F4A7966